MEATTHYLYQETALEVVPALPNEPQVIAVLRDPAERAYSSFQYTKHNLARTSSPITFSEYVAMALAGLSESRAKHLFGLSGYVLRNDLRYGRYVDYLTRWVEAMGSERVGVFIFERMRDDAAAFMHELCGHLELDPVPYEEYAFDRKNETIHTRSRVVHRMARRVSHLVPRGRLRRVLLRVYTKLQSGGEARTRSPADEKAIEALREHFAPYNERLGRVFDVDVADWSPGTGA